MKLSKKIYLIAGLCLALALPACSKQENKTAPAKEEANHEAPAVVHETKAIVAPHAETNEIKGTIIETFDSGGYTYMQIDSNGKKIWAAVRPVKVKAGDEVALLSGGVMKNFHSRTLDRTFDEIIFSAGIKGKAPVALPHTAEGNNDFAKAMSAEGVNPVDQQAVANVTMGSSKAIVPFQEIKIDKAEGKNGVTVEEVFAKAQELNGKKVLVRGKVLKFSPKIMGKNWIHIQDGTGNPMQNTHDLVVTTMDQAAPESVILVEGVLAKDKDFGAGYKYKAIIEDAVIIK